MIQLLHSTGHPRIDGILQGMIGLFELTFPTRIRSYYLVGSYARGAAGPLSDIDLRVIFRETFLEGEEAMMLQVRAYCRQISPVPLDCPPLSEARLATDKDWLHEPLGIQAEGVLLYGDEIRNQWPPPDFAAYVRNVTAVPIARFHALRQSAPPLVYPMAYPDADGEYYGYDQLDNYSGVRTLKPWIHAVGFVATCLLALQAGQIVAGKEEWLPRYQQRIGDEWADWLATVYRKGAQEWGYHIPVAPADKTLLRDLCRKTLHFENHYLQRYLAYLAEEADAADASRRTFADGRLREIHVS
jgi:hypothetical protein